MMEFTWTDIPQRTCFPLCKRTTRVSGRVRAYHLYLIDFYNVLNDTYQPCFEIIICSRSWKRGWTSVVGNLLFLSETGGVSSTVHKKVDDVKKPERAAPNIVGDLTFATRDLFSCVIESSNTMCPISRWLLSVPDMTLMNDGDASFIHGC